MSNYVKISCLAPPLKEVDPGQEYEAVVNQMIEKWEEHLLHVLPEQPDLIVLPECCDDPAFKGMSTEWLYEFYRHRGDRIRDFFAGVARAHRCYIAYSANVELPDGSFRNATQFLDRSGNVCGVYNKNFITIRQKSTSGTLYGNEAQVIQTDFGRVACIICFDINFNELLEQYVQQKPDLIVFSSAYHGGLLQAHWAYTCRAHFASAIWRPDYSSIITPVGEVAGESTLFYPFVTRTINLDSVVVHYDYNWEKLEKVKRKYGSKVMISDPTRLNAFLISSETDEFTIQDIVEEFDLELLDDYWIRCRADRGKPGHLEP
ncbi:Predicted amidohydrolase [Paenibacillus sp. UNCCL117]|uniref:carbon-nitrogen hydrolase family protein n=1 Tax=unclassified Paenibacillus TaxID=185978 RepID=UPI00088B87C9|nr:MULTISPECIES: carbon-nitrogen hydrolase family protein [unclassified Paenibacillus]SDD05125.1 Predicted amidohydrolase [Paenibacillus sp. cl123]SFW31936.1 Predicted amidohydrolase [Paenibacillus sp. UNCCL117]